MVRSRLGAHRWRAPGDGGCSHRLQPARRAAAQGSDSELVKVKALFASATNNVPMMVAAENGYWRERGLDVTVQVLDTGSEIATALVTGAADIGAGNATSSVPLSRAAGNDFVLVGPYHNNPLVVAGTERVAIIAGADSGVRAGDPQSLVGKTVAVTEGNTNENYLRAYLKAHRMSMRRHQDREPGRAGHADGALAGQRRRGRAVGAAGQRDHPHRWATTPSSSSEAGRTAPVSSASWSPTSTWQSTRTWWSSTSSGRGKA